MAFLTQTLLTDAWLHVNQHTAEAAVLEAIVY